MCSNTSMNKCFKKSLSRNQVREIYEKKLVNSKAFKTEIMLKYTGHENQEKKVKDFLLTSFNEEL